MPTTVDDILNSHRTRRPVVMAVVNVTPDSFSDGGRFLNAADATSRAAQAVEEGADVLDIGAESTRPGSDRVTAGEQIDRLREILPAVCRWGVPVSIDTTSAEVAAFALSAGAAIVNDVSAGRDDPELLRVAADLGAPLILMHMLGAPKTMQADPRYDDVVGEVCAFLTDRIAAAVAAGVPADRCIVDPGIGFGKELPHNLQLLAGTSVLCRLGRPVLIGASRKRFIGEITGVATPADRLGGSLAAACSTYTSGASIFRVHDVAQTRQALDVTARIGGAFQSPG